MSGQNFDSLLYRLRSPCGIGAPSDHDAMEDAAKEIERLGKQVFVPGMMKCAKCGFVVMHMVLRAADGAVGVKASIEPEQCPNGCGPFWRVTERDSGNEVCDRLEKSVLRERDLEVLVRDVLGDEGTYVGDEGADRGLTLFSRLGETGWFHRARAVLKGEP